MFGVSLCVRGRSKPYRSTLTKPSPLALNMSLRSEDRVLSVTTDCPCLFLRLLLGTLANLCYV